MSRKIYLDNNASTFMDERVADHIVNTLDLLRGNPSSTHSFGQKMRGMLSEARAVVSTFLGVKPAEILFNSGGTEGINMIIRGIAVHRRSGHIVTSSAEHSCVFTTIKELEKAGLQATFLQTGFSGAVKPEDVRAAIRSDTLLIALMSVNNETGVKTDVEAMATIAAAAGIPLLVDGVALMGKELFSIPPGVSAMCFSGHKFHAPQGVGFAFVRSGLKLQPQTTGGEQEFGRRPGTENMLGIRALAKAVELLADELPLASQRMDALREKFEKTLQMNLPDVFVNGEGSRTVNVSNLAFSGVDGETLLMALDAAGIAASHGSACSSGALEPSRILLNMGLPLDRVRSSIRFSFSRFTAQDEIDKACQVIIRLVKHLRHNRLVSKEV